MTKLASGCEPSPITQVGLKTGEFEKIRRLAHEKFGLDLKSGKEELVAARLGRILRRQSLQSFSAYYDYVQADASGEALVEMIDALTTNHTSFLREPAHFAFLENVVRSEFPNTGTLRVWSAACSTGEEPYSIAFHLMNAGLPTNAFRILATDISTRALSKARQAVYPSERFRQVPQQWHRRFLLKGEASWDGWFKVKPDITSTVEFRRINLMEPFPPHEKHHIIFCRNVMIYFDRATQTDVVRRLAACLEPGGYLFVGHSESLSGVDHPLDYCQPAVYRQGRKGAR